MLLFLFLNLILFKTLIYRQWKKDFPYPLRDYKNLTWRWRVLIMFRNSYLRCPSPLLSSLALLSVRSPGRMGERTRPRVFFGDWVLIFDIRWHQPFNTSSPYQLLTPPLPPRQFSNNHYSEPKLLKWSSRIKQRTNICTVSTYNHCSILLILFSFHNVFGLMKTSHFVSSQSKAVD